MKKIIFKKFFAQNAPESTFICSTPNISHGKFEMSPISSVKKQQRETPKERYMPKQYEGTPVRHIKQMKPKRLYFKDFEEDSSSEDTIFKLAENASERVDALTSDGQVTKRKRVLTQAFDYSFSETENENDHKLYVKRRRIS